MPPLRRPFGTLPGAQGGVAGQPMMPRMGMTGAPANNPRPGMPGPQAGASGMPGQGGAPGGMPPVPPVPPPIQPQAGGPTAPMNAGPMLRNADGQQPGMPGQNSDAPGGPQGAQRRPLAPWGGQGGNTGMAPSESPDAMGAAGDPMGGSGAKSDDQLGQMSPVMLIKMLKAAGKI